MHIFSGVCNVVGACFYYRHFDFFVNFPLTMIRSNNSHLLLYRKLSNTLSNVNESILMGLNLIVLFITGVRAYY